MFSLGLVAHFFFMLNNTETFLKDYAAWMEAKFKSVHLKNMKGMFFKQGCSALEQNLLARNHNFLLNIQPSYSPIFFWTLIYNVPQNIIPFVYNLASVYSTYRQWFRSLVPNLICLSFRIIYFFFRNGSSTKNLKVLHKGQTIIFKHELVDVFAFKYMKT